MTAKIPGPTKTTWLSSETTRARFEIAATLVAGASVVYKATVDKASSGILDFAVAALVLILINGLFRHAAARRKDREAQDRNDPQHLLAPLRVLYAIVANQKQLGGDEAGRLIFRVTLHRNLPNPGEHQQVVPYVGGRQIDPKKVVGRTWLNHCGLVGLAIRNRDLRRVALGPHVDTEDKYVKELIDLYGYTEDQARQLQPMRLDALAIPIKLDGQVLGVVYADSSQRNFFDDATVNLCVLVSAAITQHIETTYTGG